MKNFFEINRALAAKKKLFTFFALSAIVLGMASCGDGNEPEAKVVTFQVDVISSRIHVTVTPTTPNQAFFWWYVAASEITADKTLQQYVEEKLAEKSYDEWVKGFYICTAQSKAWLKPEPNTKYIVYACNVEKDAEENAKIVGKIQSEEFTTGTKYLLQSEFSVAENKKVHFGDCNMNSYEDLFEQYWYIPKAKAQPKEMYDLYTWNDMMDNLGSYKVPSADQWKYLFLNRPHAAERFTFATIRCMDGKDRHGLLILPDEWQTPDGITLKTAKDLNLVWNDSEHKYTASSALDDGYAKNIFEEATAWWELEKAGAVFLPAAGTNGAYIGTRGAYWSSSFSSSGTNACRIVFTANELNLDGLYNPVAKTANLSVRVIK